MKGKRIGIALVLTMYNHKRRKTTLTGNRLSGISRGTSKLRHNEQFSIAAQSGSNDRQAPLSKTQAPRINKKKRVLVPMLVAVRVIIKQREIQNCVYQPIQHILH